MQWWKHSHPDEQLDNPSENEDFVTPPSFGFGETFLGKAQHSVCIREDNNSWVSACQSVKKRGGVEFTIQFKWQCQKWHFSLQS